MPRSGEHEKLVGRFLAATEELSQAEASRLAGAAIEEPNRHEATRFLLTALERVDSQLPGLRNEGLFATHELVTDVPGRPDWPAALELGRSLMARRGRELVEGLGFQVETHGPATSVLRIPDDGLPYNRSAVYTRHALKTKARELADRANEEDLAPGAAPVFDPDQDDLWAELQALWASIDRGNADWEET